jgi:hypothetical protein
MRFNRLFWAGLAVGVFFGALILLGLAIARADGHAPERPYPGVPDPGTRPVASPASITLPDDCTVLRDAAIANVDNRAEGYVYRMTVLKCADIPWEKLPQP